MRLFQVYYTNNECECNGHYFPEAKNGKYFSWMKSLIIAIASLLVLYAKIMNSVKKNKDLINKIVEQWIIYR